MIFWTTLFFTILLLVLRKFAWPAILTAVHTRNESIRQSLESAERAKEEMARLKADNEKVLGEARAEKDALLQEARVIRDRIIAEAKEEAGEEAEKLVGQAREAIRNEKAAALDEIKKQVAVLSVDIAEKLLQDKLKSGAAQKELMDKLISKADLN